jgi:hypothetical protein
MTKDEALKLALEALETTGAKSSDQWQKERKAITAIKQALAAPTVQEPVAWLYPEGLEALQNGKCWTAYPTKHDGCNIPLCAPPAAQRQWVGLSQDELDAMFSNTIKGKKLVNYVARAIEAKLKERNQ